MLKKIFAHPWLNIGIIAVITLFFGWQLPKTKIDNDVLTMLPEHNQARVDFMEMDKTFGDSMAMAVVVESRQGSVLTAEGIELVKRLTTEFEKISYVKEVTSLTNMDYIAGTEDGMAVMPLVGDFDGSPQQIAAIKDRLLSWDIYRGMLIADDYSATQIGVVIKGDAEVEQREHIYYSLEKILKENPQPHFNFYLAGTPAVTVLVADNMHKDIITLIPFVVVVVLIVLYLSFKRLSGVILPMLAVIISTTWAIGLMAFIELPLSILGTIIPVLMVAVGSAYGIHVISHYYDELRENSAELSYKQHRELVFSTLKKVGSPVLMAGLTTMAGFGSLAVSEVLPMRHFGIFTAIGVGAALIVALTLIPSLLLVRHQRQRTNGVRNGSHHFIEHGIEGYHRLFGRHQWLVVISAIIILGIAVYGTTRLKVDNVLIKYFKKQTAVRVSDAVITKKFAGTNSFSIIVRGQKPGDGSRPQVLKAMDDLARFLEKDHPDVSKVISYSDFIRRMNQVMHADTPGASQIHEENSNTADDGESVGSFFSQGDGAPGGGTASGPDNGSGSFFTDNSGSGSFFQDQGESGSFFAEATQPEDTVPPASSVPTPNKAMDLTPASFMQDLYSAYAKAAHRNISAGELLDLLAREYNFQGKAFDEIPSIPAKYGLATTEELHNLISQYLILLSGNIRQWADDPLEPQQIKMTVQLKTSSTSFLDTLVPETEQYIQEFFPAGYTVKIAGIAIAQDSLNNLITSSAIYSILVSLFLVFLIVAIKYRSLTAGLLSLIPLGTTILINFGVMGLLGIDLDMPTAMVGALAVGIGIDYTIHFLASYSWERKQSSDLYQVTGRALLTSGKAIIFNALAVAAGFSVLVFSQFVPLIYLGLLIALTMLTSSLASLTILPVVLNIGKPKFLLKS